MLLREDVEKRERPRRECPFPPRRFAVPKSKGMCVSNLLNRVTHTRRVCRSASVVAFRPDRPDVGIAVIEEHPYEPFFVAPDALADFFRKGIGELV